jgi:hypothetical protein
MVPAVDVDRFLVHDREVVVAESDDRNTSIATLIGEYHELMTVFAGPRPDRTTLRNLFGLLEITDHVEGMTVRPRSATMLDVLSEAMSVAVDGFGSLDVPGPHQSLNLRPAHRGQATRHGEVWRMTRPDVPQPRRARDYGFLLACEAGLAEVDLPHVEGATDAAALAWLDDIKVAWQKA